MVGLIVPIVMAPLPMVAAHFAALPVLVIMPEIEQTISIQQFDEIKNKMHTKWKNGKYMAYFQAFTNTHAPVDVLREKYETVLNQEGVVGLSIATRPDCLPDDVVDYLAELNERTYLWVELGLADRS